VPRRRRGCYALAPDFYKTEQLCWIAAVEIVIVEVFAGLNNAHPHVQRLREHRRIQLLKVLLQDGFGVLLSAHLRRDTHL
jgi:hypothetical protein